MKYFFALIVTVIAGYILRPVLNALFLRAKYHKDPLEASKQIKKVNEKYSEGFDLKKLSYNPKGMDYEKKIFVFGKELLEKEESAKTPSTKERITVGA